MLYLVGGDFRSFNAVEGGGVGFGKDGSRFGLDGRRRKLEPPQLLYGFCPSVVEGGATCGMVGGEVCT